MINGTKLLNVAGMTRARRDGILKAEKTRHVVKFGPLHLKGVWIPYERALDFANHEKITEMLFPLFVNDIGLHLYHPSNWPEGVLSNDEKPDSIVSHPSAAQPWPSFDLAHTFLTPPMTASSIMGMDAQNGPTGSSTAAVSISVPATPATTPPENAITDLQQNLGTPPYDAPEQGYNAPATPISNDTCGRDENLVQGRVRSPWTEKGKLPNPRGNHNSNNDTAPASPDSVESPPVEVEFANKADFKTNTPQNEYSLEGEDAKDDDANGIDKTALSPEGTEAPSSSTSTTFSSVESVTDSDAGISAVISREQQKLVLVDRLMRYFYAWLDPRIGTSARGHNDGTSNSNTSFSPSRISSTVATSSSAISGEHGIKRRREESSERGDNHSDEDDRKGKRRKRDNNVAVEIIRKLACPYYKHEPSKYQTWRSCPGPGWDTVHRLKYVVHFIRTRIVSRRPQILMLLLGNTCIDAMLFRFSAIGVVASLNLTPFLTIINEPLTLAINEMNHPLRVSIKTRRSYCEAERSVRSIERRRRSGLRSIRSSSLMSFRSRFLPHVSLLRLVTRTIWKRAVANCSPDYELQDEKGKGRQYSPMSAEFAHYEQFLRSELPSRVRQEIVNEIEKELDPVEEKLKSKLPEIVRLVQRTLFETYPGSHSEGRSSSDLEVANSSGHSGLESYNDSGANDQIALEIAAADDQLAPFFPTPFADFMASFDPNDMLMEPPNLYDTQSQGDPGYYSITGLSSEDCWGGAEQKEALSSG